jgi:hypothetical protein
MGGDGRRCLYLFQPVAKIHVGDRVLRSVLVGILFVLVTLNLQRGR